ncbi:MAG: hypothetical protein GYA47_00675 [Desulfovibrio sp.]|nr:hypothetical protein [Desulfovibrio sp.]
MNVWRDIFSDESGRLSTMRILVFVVIVNEMIMRWVALFWIGQASISTWSDIASVAVPFGAKAAQSAFERPWGAPPMGGLPCPPPPMDGGNLGGGDL